MPAVQPPAARSRIEDMGPLLRITIPSPKYWLQIAFASVWLVVWAIVEISVGATMCSLVFGLVTADGGTLAGLLAASPGELFLLAWFSVWTVGGAWVLYLWLWQIAGREVVEVDGRALMIRQQVPGWGRPREYLAEHVRALRVVPALSPYFGWPRGMEMWGLAGGPLAFDYGARTLRFGAGLDEAEAKQILAAIVRRYPLLAREA